jgi:hypothetical protein
VPVGPSGDGAQPWGFIPRPYSQNNSGCIPELNPVPVNSEKGNGRLISNTFTSVTPLTAGFIVVGGIIAAVVGVIIALIATICYLLPAYLYFKGNCSVIATCICAACSAFNTVLQTAWVMLAIAGLLAMIGGIIGISIFLGVLIATVFSAIYEAYATFRKCMAEHAHVGPGEIFAFRSSMPGSGGGGGGGGGGGW